MCELVYRGVGASPQTRIVLFEHCVFFFKDELHIHFWSTKQVLKMFILPRMLTLLNIKYPKSRMCFQKTACVKEIKLQWSFSMAEIFRSTYGLFFKKRKSTWTGADLLITGNYLNF